MSYVTQYPVPPIFSFPLEGKSREAGKGVRGRVPIGCSIAVLTAKRRPVSFGLLTLRHACGMRVQKVQKVQRVQRVVVAADAADYKKAGPRPRHFDRSEAGWRNLLPLMVRATLGGRSLDSEHHGSGSCLSPIAACNSARDDGGSEHPSRHFDRSEAEWRNLLPLMVWAALGREIFRLRVSSKRFPSAPYRHAAPLEMTKEPCHPTVMLKRKARLAPESLAVRMQKKRSPSFRGASFYLRSD